MKIAAFTTPQKTHSKFFDFEESLEKLDKMVDF